MAGNPEKQHPSLAQPPKFKIETFSVELPAAPSALPPDQASPVYRRQLGSDEWDNLKSLVKRLYVDENKTFDEVAEVFREEYNFNPT